MTTHRLSCIGDTRPAKDSLKARGWRWDATAKNWHKLLSDAEASRIIAGDDAFFRGLGGHKKGCQLLLDGIVRWTSKTFVGYAAPQPAGTRADQDGCGWNTDAAGNPVAAQKIPGSAPGDMI